MILKSWAERLLGEPGTPDVIELHVKDVVAAFFTGLRTSDGQTIVQRHRGSTERAERAATVAAIARLSECDDIHLASCVTLGSIAIPVALALLGTGSADDFSRAVSAGYAAGPRLGMAIGGARALARGVWPTLFAAPVIAAVTASVLSRGDPEQLAHAMALALARADGRVGNPSERWTMLADAVLRGIRAAEAAQQERGDLEFLPEHFDVAAFNATDASIATVGFKPFPIARQGANAVVAFQHLMAKGIGPHEIDTVEVFVPEINTALLNRKSSETDRLSRLCDMGLQLAAAALAPDVLYDAEREASADLTEFARRVTVNAANDLETHWPNRWAARVVIHTAANRYEETVVQAPFDHDAPGLEPLLREKWRRMLSPRDCSLLNHEQPGAQRYATLWDRIERRLRSAAEE